MWNDKLKYGLLAICTLALAACGTPPSTSTASSGSIPVTSSGGSAVSTTSSASGMGVVQAIDVVPRQQAGVGLGTVAGAVVGGVLGNQVGGGSGRTAATVAGTAGGALAGHEMEKNAQAAGGNQVYRIAVRMDNGSVQTLMQDTPPQVQTGERVRLENGVIVERFR